MRQTLQATVRSPIELEGISIETGLLSKWIVYPAEVDQGIVFVRETESRQTLRIPATHKVVHHADGYVRLGHQIGVNGIEHILSILHGVGITNAEIFCPTENPPENTREFAKLIYDNKALQSKEVEYYKYRSQIFHFNERAVEVNESDRFKVTCFFDFESPHVPERLKYSVVVTPESYIDKICTARTFCSRGFLDMLQHSNRALGAAENNCLVIPDDPEESFVVDLTELVRHKILDFVGDISLIGKPVLGDFVLFNPNHTMSYLMNQENDRNGEVLFKPQDGCD